MQKLIIDWLLVGDRHIEHELCCVCFFSGSTDRWKDCVVDAIEQNTDWYSSDDLLSIKNALELLSLEDLSVFKSIAHIGGQAGKLRIKNVEEFL